MSWWLLIATWIIVYVISAFTNYIIGFRRGCRYVINDIKSVLDGEKPIEVWYSNGNGFTSTTYTK